MTKWTLSQGCKDSLIFANQSMWYTMLTNWKIKNMIISIDVEKAFDKIQHPFMIKTLQKAGIEGMYVNIIKAIYDNLQQRLSSWWKIESISPNVRNKTRVPTLTATIQHSFGNFNHSNQIRKINKRNPDQKRSTTLTVCRWHDSIHRKHTHKKTIRKLLKLISEFSKVMGYKVNTDITCTPIHCCCCWVTSVMSDSVRPHRQQPTRLPRP